VGKNYIANLNIFFTFFYDRMYYPAYVWTQFSLREDKRLEAIRNIDLVKQSL